MRKNSTLQQLSVSTYKISNGAIDAICSFVRHNQTMSNFQLRFALSDAALSRLLQSLCFDKKLKVMMLYPDSESGELVDAICYFVHHNHTMTHLKLNFQSGAALSRILKCLCFNKTLKVMKLYSIQESSELVDAICDFVHYNNTMTHLEMEDFSLNLWLRLINRLVTDAERKLVLLLTALRESPMLTLRLSTIKFDGEDVDLLMNTLGVSSPVTSIEAIKKGPDPCLKVMRSGAQQPSYYFYLRDVNRRLMLLEQEEYKTAKQAQIEEQRRGEPLSNELKAVLDRNRDNLVDNMTPDRVYDHLRKDNSLTLLEVEDVTFNKPRYQQVQMLLDFLHRKSWQDYENFKKALIETQQDYLEEVLTAAERKAGIYEKPIQEHLQDLLSTAEGDAGIH